MNAAQRLVLAVAFAGLLPCAALAHALRLTVTAGDGVVGGHLFYSDETPAAGEWVELQALAGQEAHRLRTDAQGRFRFAGIAPGTWRLIAEGEEGHRVESDVRLVAGGAAAPADVAALREEIRALREDVQRHAQRVRLGEVLGGLGLIAGLAGAWAWSRSRAAHARPAQGD